MALFILIVLAVVVIFVLKGIQAKKDFDDPLFQLKVAKLVGDYEVATGSEVPAHLMPEIYRLARKEVKEMTQEREPQEAETNRKNSYEPPITGGTPIRAYEHGQYRAVLAHEVESAGPMKYLYCFMVFEGKNESPIFFVTAEVNSIMGQLLDFVPEELREEASKEANNPFLCVSDRNGHQNLGNSLEYGKIENFEHAALAIAQKKLNLSSPMRRTR